MSTRQDRLSSIYIPDCVGREDVIQELHDAYDEVATKDDEGRYHPQFKILLGMTGVGKTRIAQELYSWLTIKRDTDSTETGYWPNTLLAAESDGVNPFFDRYEDRPWTEIPFLWWGLKFERGNLAGDALLRAVNLLPSHTSSVMARRLASAQFWENCQRLGGYGLDLVPVVKEIKSVYGLVKDGWNVFATRRDRLNAEAQGGQRIAEQFQQERIKNADKALESLRQFLDQFDNAAPTVPVVMFLDDAHWIDYETMSFVSQLWQTAVTKGWPLLVVATHWADEWKRFQKADQELFEIWDQQAVNPAQTPQNLAEFLNHLADEPRVGVETIDIDGIDELAAGQIIRSALGGVTNDQVDLMIDKALVGSRENGRMLRCSPRMITLMIDLCLKRPNEFLMEGKLDHPLTRSAETWFQNEVERLDLEQIVLKRFEGFEEELRLALGWSSIQGRRFLAEITRETARRLAVSASDLVFPSLRRCESPEMWVEQIKGQDQNSTFNLCVFRQRIFQEVAAKHFTIDNDYRTAVDNTVSEVLESWLINGKLEPPRFGEIRNGQDVTREELRDLLIMAVDRFDPSEGPISLDTDRWGQTGRHGNSTLFGLAAAKLTRLNADDGLWNQAEQTAIKFSDAFDGICSIETVPARLQFDVIRVLNETMEYTRGQKLAASVVDQVRPLHEENRSSESMVHLVRAMLYRGDCELCSGRLSDAKRTFGDLHHILSHPNLTTDADSDWEHWLQRSLSVSLDRVGDIDLQEGNRKEALKRYQQSLNICEKIVEQFGETPQSLRDVSVSLDRIGDIELKEGSRENALKRHQQSLDICQKIVDQFGESPLTLRDVSVSLSKVGDIELQDGKREVALERFQESLDICQRIVQQFGEAPQSLRDVSASLDRVGDIRRQDGDRIGALERYQRSLKIREKIVEQFGETPLSLRDVSVSLNKVGDIELLEENPEAALNLYQQSLDIRQKIVRRFGEAPQSLRDAAVSLNKVGDVELLNGKLQDALKRYQQSLALRERIVEQFGEAPQSLSDLVICRIRLSESEPTSAKDHLTQALKIAEQLQSKGWLTAQQSGWCDDLRERIEEMNAPEA